MRIELKSERLILKPLTTKDIDSYMEYSGDPERTKYMLFQYKDRAASLEFLKEIETEWDKPVTEKYEFAVYLNSVSIGNVSIYLDNPKLAELGWIILPEYGGSGYAVEAALRMMEFGFNELGVDKIYAECDQRNVPSRNVMERIGMSLEDDKGMRTYERTGETAPEFIYSIRKEEWKCRA